MHCFHIFVQVKTLEQTAFNVLILGKPRFPPKRFYDISFWSRVSQDYSQNVVVNLLLI